MNNKPSEGNYDRGMSLAARGLAVFIFGLMAGVFATTVFGTAETIAKFAGLSIGWAETLNVVGPALPGLAMMVFGGIVSNRKD
jgi:membrane protein DedA with SNARE-associated domain